jgi:pimeloyl-ACP methyl ester carboxylesterase
LGEQDLIIPIKSTYRFQNHLPNYSLVILKNLGHMPTKESPNESLKVVMRFEKLKFIDRF